MNLLERPAFSSSWKDFRALKPFSCLEDSFRPGDKFSGEMVNVRRRTQMYEQGFIWPTVEGIEPHPKLKMIDGGEIVLTAPPAPRGRPAPQPAAQSPLTFSPSVDWRKLKWPQLVAYGRHKGYIGSMPKRDELVAFLEAQEM